ncbi:MAG: class I SAM-dependent DNA methyltransferase [Sphingobacteriales bacterium]
MELKEEISLPEALEKLEMDDIHSSGLRWVAQKEAEKKNPDIYIALEQASLFGAEAVYFRFFNDERPARPQVYIYSPQVLSLPTNYGAEIHHRLWNAGMVPYCFIYSGSKILVYNCGRKPLVDDAGEEFVTRPDDILDLLKDVQEKLQSYSARQFDSGLFWDSTIGKGFKYDQSAYEQLLIQLKNVKVNIISSVGADKTELVKRILMMLILIKYLEERKDENGNGALNPQTFYKDFNPANPTLSGILADPDIFISMLAKLSTKEHFNGRFFLLNDPEKATLKEIGDLQVFRMFVEGNVLFNQSARHGIGQMSLWRLYQFNYLPIELISHIYEDFLADESGQKKKGVVYTPPYLVQFLIDRCMPLAKPEENFKILDPACGSGIFLVGAFKRMIQWWRLKNNWVKPTKDHIEELKQILRNNIFGCDLEGEAVTLSYFSLGLALLDALSPKEIWNNVHFDNLIGQNLLSGDFFQTLDNKTLPTDFRLVIGNPPFNSELTSWAKKVNKSELKSNPDRPDVPDNQIALLFLEQSFNLLKMGGNSCLILPSGPVLYNTQTHDFKKYLFSQNQFQEIYDFTPLRAKLFIGSSSSAKPAVLVTFAEKGAPSAKTLRHIIFRRTRASGEKIEFEIDHYDIHNISYKMALNTPGVWQASFMGGGRLYKLLNKFNTSTKLASYLEDKADNYGWKIAEGWIESPNNKSLKRIKALKSLGELSNTEQQEFAKLESKFKADWVTGFPYVETDSFSEDGIGKTNICDIEYFYRSTKENKEIFQPPHLLIKESVTGKRIPVVYSDDYLTFKDKILGIHSPYEDIRDLKALENLLKNENNIALMWLLSGQVLTSREGVPLKRDILDLPYPEIEFDEIEKILLQDINDHYAEFRKEGEKSDILSPVTKPELTSFGETYCRIMNAVYKEFRPLDPIVGKEFIVYPFVLGAESEVEIPETMDKAEAQLKSLLNIQSGYNLWIKRILKIFDKNVVFFYKPNQKRYWLRSIAIRDADETFMDLYNQGK